MPDWRTNRRTRKRFPTDDSDPFNNIARNEEMLAPATDADVRDSNTFWCDGCEANREGQKYGVNGRTICKECKEAIVSGQIFAPTAPTPSVSSGPTDYEHTIPPNSGHSCAGCGATNRNLCPCHERCYTCRPANCA